MIVVPLVALLMFMVLPAIWLIAIRPYCVKHGKGFTPGANVAVTIWVDWQQATELARVRKDLGMLFWCRAFLVIQIVGVAFLLVAILASSVAP